jgi:hypothetical protein
MKILTEYEGPPEEVRFLIGLVARAHRGDTAPLCRFLESDESLDLSRDRRSRLNGFIAAMLEDCSSALLRKHKDKAKPFAGIDHLNADADEITLRHRQPFTFKAKNLAARAAAYLVRDAIAVWRRAHGLQRVPTESRHRTSPHPQPPTDALIRLALEHVEQQTPKAHGKVTIAMVKNAMKRKPRRDIIVFVHETFPQHRVDPAPQAMIELRNLALRG